MALGCCLKAAEMHSGEFIIPAAHGKTLFSTYNIFVPAVGALTLAAVSYTPVSKEEQSKSGCSVAQSPVPAE